MASSHIPRGYHEVTPYLMVEGADAVLDFLEKTFGALRLELLRRPDGRVLHAEVAIGDSRLMVSEATPDHPPMPGMLYVYVLDADETYRRALAAGGVSLMEPSDQFYGDRHGGVRDPAGNQWWIATRLEDVSPEELERRAQGASRPGGA